jgi:nuclear transport factor 2 (NTF2) superfamily protein
LLKRQEKLKSSIMKNKIPSARKFFQSAIFIFIIPLFLISCTSVPELPTNDEAKTAVWEKIKAANDRWASGDPMGFLASAAQDITWFDDIAAQKGVSGFTALNEYMETLKGAIPEHKNELVDPVFQFYNDMVIVCYHYHTYLDGELVAIWRATSVYRYAEGDWLSVHENWSEEGLPSG